MLWCITARLTPLMISSRFWEMEETPTSAPVYTPQEKEVVQHFHDNHLRKQDGTFVIPLPRRPGHQPLDKSRTQAVRRFQALERMLHRKGKFGELNDVIQEYLDLHHAEPVPEADLEKPPSESYYFPIHVVYKTSSTTTKVRAVVNRSIQQRHTSSGTNRASATTGCLSEIPNPQSSAHGRHY